MYTMSLAICLAALLAVAGVAGVAYVRKGRPRRGQIPVSVNYHFTRECNYSCGFCFHTAKTSHLASVQDARRGLRLLREAGMRKINFAGGEPFLKPKFLGEMIDYCKQSLRLESVSIVTNGSLVRREFLRRHGHHIDVLAVSCDSFIETTNKAIGRGTGGHVTKLTEIASWCREYNIKFKINTVVNRLNYDEDMNHHIAALQPFRWKCFQVLVVEGENDSGETLRDARGFAITDGEFEHFCQRHRDGPGFVAESNKVMAQSYLIVDEYLRFLDKSGRKKSRSILEVGVREALESVFWDEEAFVARGGIYDWKKSPCSEMSKGLEW
ncbi:Radical S-adenosyl methionine domain-containing protein 2 [Escovopsis weberi]|uniref:Radical S-adenosyl methionine domain-containing protein 2 n=1 Tax=Escovopsis weberi TaxID=150374 RepID=A0A0M9VV40_ESCWE|nr:Radical S-adenosyl methionine domain-containing protein 2 [Escovopsis weberi]